MKERPGAQLCNSSAAVLYRKACTTSVTLLYTGPPRLVGFPWDPLYGLAGKMRRPEAAVSLANSGPHRIVLQLGLFPFACFLAQALC